MAVADRPGGLNPRAPPPGIPAAAPAGAYPIALVSYLIGCEQYEDPAKAAIVKSYFEYMASEDGQQAASDNAGSAPISAGLRDKVLAAIDTIKVD